MSFEHLKSIYRDFDIRGLYGTEITDIEVYKIARALALHYPLRTVAVGYDIRPSASALFTALSQGFRDSGVHVINLGLCTTPMSYFMCGSTDVDMTVMITASHMPSEYNGLKISVDDAKPGHQGYSASNSRHSRKSYFFRRSTTWLAHQSCPAARLDSIL